MSIGRSQRQERTKRISSNPKPQQGKATETNKQNKQTNNPLYEEQYHTTTTTTTITDLPRWMDSIELLFLHLPTLNRRWEWITSGLEGSTTRISNRVKSPPSSDHQLPLSRNFNRNFATSAGRKQNLQKVNSINALDLFFFSIPRVFSML